MITAQDFKNNIEIKTQKTKGELAQELYPQDYYSWDCAIPINWIIDTQEYLKNEGIRVTKNELTSNFIWLYSPIYNGAAPLTLQACEWLETLEKIERESIYG